MKIKNVFVSLIIIIGLLLFSQAAMAVPNASILYNETDLQNGFWQYDYTFANISNGDENLFGVQLYFGDHFDIGNTLSGDNWSIINTTSFIGTYSGNYAEDIAIGNSLSGFSFTVDNQVGNISYAAFFDEHNGSRSYSTGITALNAISNTPVAPEPISTVLFLTGGVTMAFRYRQKRKKQLS